MLGLTACAGPNPNPGERTVDMAWEKYDYDTAFEVLMPAAERGEPWAQLRLGVAYELGSGVTRDIPKAIMWYEKAAAQESDGNWANGQLVGATGKSGYFNQNSDALIAKFQLANIYLRGEGVEPNPEKALQLAKYVSDKTQGNSIFYCCEFSGGRYIANTAIAETLAKAKAAQ
ncbi:sel1 repeat family protein [Shewanella marisflavi]|uniref:Sel1 repeat family protein n=2 Tax=Shewanellaceae TaxID=267890 RepID=A0ABX5WS02_9GAMM|nr:sel1 repeat family protein [Shewanella marisflavi]